MALPTKQNVIDAVSLLETHVDMWMSSKSMGEETDEYPRLEWSLQGDSQQIYGNGELIMTVRDGTADYYTLDAFDPSTDVIHRLLIKAGLRPRMSLVQAEEDNSLHYQWVFSWAEMMEGDDGESHD